MVEEDRAARAPRRLSVSLTCLMIAAVVLGLVLTFVVGPIVRRNRRGANEGAAIRSLKQLGRAQTKFRESDLDKNGVQDYGSLDQLAAAQLIDEALGSGTREGYFFRARASATTSEFLWWAQAYPQVPATTGDRWFAINQAGVINFSSRGPMEIDPQTCEIHSGLVVCRCGCGGIKPDAEWLAAHPDYER